MIFNNTFRHSKYRLKSFNEQLTISKNSVVEQKLSLNKVREFYSALKEQDEINTKKNSIIYNQCVNCQNQYEASKKYLQKTKEDLGKYQKVRSILGRMVVRRINLCQLLYKKFARFYKYIHQKEKNIEIISKCIHSLKIQIRQHRKQNRKIIEKNDKLQLEVNLLFIHSI